MVRRRFPLGAVVVAATLVALALPGFQAAFAAEADSTIDLTPLRGQKSVLVGTKDGRWIEGKPIGVRRDSLILKKGKNLVRMDAGGIAGVWTKRPAPARGALVYGLGGLVGGALVEIGLGADCPECGVDASDVLQRAAINAALFGAVGALGGLFGGGWEQLVPGTAEGKGAEPFPTWSATAAGGSATSKANGLYSDDSEFYARTATWIHNSATGSSGVEFGTLPGGDIVGGGPLGAGDTYEETARSRWGYVTVQTRSRARQGTVRPEVTFGVGSYIEQAASTLVERDSLGVVFHQRTDESRGAWFGINLGAGIGLGNGPFFPGVDARVHWAISPGNVWYTLGLKADWH